MADNTTKTPIAACELCGAVSLVPSFMPPVVGNYVRSCAIVHSDGFCSGTVRVLGVLLLEAPPDA